MFKRPEEIIVLLLAVLWAVLTYFTAAYLTGDAYTMFLITGLTLVWAVVCFVLWQRGLSLTVWPLFLGFLVVCWWPLLDWYAVKDLIAAGIDTQAAPIDKPWYVTWTFKIILALIPAAAGYLYKFKRARAAKRQAATNFPAK
ncbi:hypothetical protein [Neisseria chenwenguii]|uniref:Uncharacterized protein n=1 Tax=Neisseria chenwenguii TaxID=1853278 RepID=A0A220S4B0_9NEIS|nr:hypothetical protein [Neisseria chenwenguii]ASK28351.1 hypothetical protein BG910_11930 [Neisseria chenwenguii]ROV55422.1 hypothetical protein EGS38_09475 [Neisseria chenwenguii]